MVPFLFGGEDGGAPQSLAGAAGDIGTAADTPGAGSRRPVREPVEGAEGDDENDEVRDAEQ